jgi:hypothetical protein
MTLSVLRAGIGDQCHEVLISPGILVAVFNPTSSRLAGRSRMPAFRSADVACRSDFRRWHAAALLAPAAITTMALATPAQASPSWQLTDQYTSSPACFTTSGGSERGPPLP